MARRLVAAGFQRGGKMSVGGNDPVNTLARWWLWKIEVDIAAKALSWVIVAVLLIIAGVWGKDACEYAFGTVMVSLVVGTLVCAVVAIKEVIFGPSQRSVDRAFARGSAGLHKAMG